MTNLNEVLELLKLYLKQSVENRGFWHLSNIKDFMPIVQVIILIITAVAGLIKYYDTKNREIYEKRLKEVYAPLYMRLVKQEYLRSIYLKKLAVKEAPIITVTKQEEKNKYNNLFSNIPSETYINETSFLNRDIFINTMKGINAGLASQSLLTLISLYESAIHIEETTKGTEQYFENGIKKLKIEVDLHHEIMKGYQDCYKKLKLDKKYNDNKWRIINNEFIPEYTASKEEIDEFKKEYNNDPSKFE